MKALGLLLVIVSSISFGQELETAKTVKNKLNFSFTQNLFLVSTNQAEIKRNLLPELSSTSFYQSDFKMVVSHQMNNTFCPTSFSSDDWMPFLGSTSTQGIKLFNKTATTTYIWDFQGNLRSSEFSIPLGKD